jgi:hypothetical protein
MIGGAAMNDAEREDLLRRLAESERARRRWKWLALVGTLVLSVLLLMMAAFGTSSYLMLRDAVRREREAREAIEAGNLMFSGSLLQSFQLSDEPEEPARMPREPGP